MKRAITVLFVIVLCAGLLGCAASVKSGPLGREDFYSYKNGEIEEAPDTTEDGQVAFLDSYATARGIKKGSSLDSLIKAYSGITAAEIYVSYEPVLFFETIDVLKDNPRAKVEDVSVEYEYQGYHLSFHIRAGKVLIISAKNSLGQKLFEAEVEEELRKAYEKSGLEYEGRK